MANRVVELITRLIARDEASTAIDKVAAKGRQLESNPITVPISAPGAEQAAQNFGYTGTKAKELATSLQQAKAASAQSNFAYTGRTAAGLGTAAEGAAKGVGKLQGVMSSLSNVAGQAGVNLGPLDSVLTSGASGAALWAGGIGAAAVAAKKAADMFEQAALAAGAFARTSGLGVEDASRWIAIADDIGIGADTIAGAFQKMQQNVGKGVLDKLGLSELQGADAQATFLNIATHLQGITDATERARLASAIFGKSWGEVSGLLLTDTKSLKAALDDVSSAQVTDPGELQRAKDYQKAMDNLGDSFKDVATAVGGIVTPALSGFAEILSSVVGPIGEAVSSLGELGDKIGEVKDMIPGLDLLPDLGGPVQWGKNFLSNVVPIGPALDLIKGKSDDAGKGAKDLGDAVDEAGAKVDDAGLSAEDAAAAEKALADAQKDAATAADLQADALKAVRDETEKQAEAARSLADINLALPGQIAAQTTAINEANAARGKDIELNEKAAEASVRTADSIRKQAEATDAAADGQGVWNRSMLAAASTAAGPLRSSILAYIGTVNEIPPEKLTEIEAAIAAGDLALAEKLLNDASRTRTASINAKAQNVASVEATIDQLARDRTVDLNVIAHTVGVAFDPTRVGRSALPAGVTPVAVNGHSAPAVATQALSPAPVEVVPAPLATPVRQRMLDDFAAALDRVPIDVYLRTFPTADDIAKAIGPVRIPVDAYIRSSPRINGTIPQ